MRGPARHLVGRVAERPGLVEVPDRGERTRHHAAPRVWVRDGHGADARDHLRARVAPIVVPLRAFVSCPPDAPPPGHCADACGEHLEAAGHLRKLDRVARARVRNRDDLEVLLQDAEGLCRLVTVFADVCEVVPLARWNVELARQRLADGQHR